MQNKLRREVETHVFIGSLAMCWQVPYVVSMQNTLQKEVDSRFFISTRSEVDLGYSKIFDGKYVAFGRVVKGIDTVQVRDRA